MVGGSRHVTRTGYRPGVRGISQSAKVICPSNILAVSSIEFCQALFDERNVSTRYGGSCGHTTMIPLGSNDQFHFVPVVLNQAQADTEAPPTMYLETLY